MSNVIVVSDYDPLWPAQFALLREGLGPQVADLALSIEHVGSTAVPGCAAKLDHIALRDCLRQRPDQVQRYSQLKKRLARRFPATAEGRVAWSVPMRMRVRWRTARSQPSRSNRPVRSVLNALRS